MNTVATHAPAPWRLHGFWAVLAALYAALIFGLSAIPGSVLNEIGLHHTLANLCHVPLYAGFTAFVLMAFAGRLEHVRRGPWPTLYTIAAVMTYAFSDEYHQRFVHGRSSSGGDLVLDFIGATLALLALYALARRGPGRRIAVERSGAASTELIVALGVALLAIAVYAPSLRAGFTDWDDPEYVLTEPVIRSLEPGNVRELWRPRFGNWAPLNTISYAIDYQNGGLAPAGYHTTNVLLHAVSSALLVPIAGALGAPVAVSAAAAALFAAHPAQVESVAWISQRKSVLSMAFMLLSFLLYIRATRGERVSRGGLMMALAFYVGALLSKVSVVVYPGILFLYDLGYRRERPARLLIEKIPFLAAALIVAWVNYDLQARARMVSEGWIGGSPVLHAATIAEIFARYFRILLLPVNLSAIYAPPDAASPFAPLALAGFALLAAGAAGFAIAWRRDRRLLVWLGFLWLGFLPVAQIVGFNLRMADRYLYIPSVGFAVLAARAAWGLRGKLAPGIPPRAIEALVAAGLACFVALTVARERVWHDPRALWSATVQREPVAWMARYNYAKMLEREGDEDGAIAAYERALEADSRKNWALINLGALHARLGEPEKAETYFRRAMDARFEDDPEKRAIAAADLGQILERKGDTRGALSAFQMAARLTPADPEPQILLARALRKSGRSGEARRRLEALLAREPPPALEKRIRAELASLANGSEAR